MTVAEPENTGAPAILMPLLGALGDPSWRSRQAAIERLANEPSAYLVSHLVEIIRNDHRDLARLNAAIQVLTRTDADVVSSLLPLLASPDPNTRAYAALALGERGDANAISALVASLSDPDTNVRVHAIEALGKLRAGAAVNPLIQFVEQLDFDVAFPALDALAAIGDERIAPRLIPLLDNPLLKTAAIDALGALGNEESILYLLKQLSDASVPAGTIALAVKSIHDRQESRYGAGRAIAEIVRRSALPAGVSALPSSIVAGKTAENIAAVAILGWLSEDGAVAALFDLLEKPSLRHASLNSLAMKGPSISRAVLDRFPHLSEDSQLGLIELCERLAHRDFVPLLMECLQSGEGEIVVRALNALARTGDERAYASAKSFLAHPSLRIRQAAVGALNSLGHPQTAADVKLLLQESEPLVCESAIMVAAYFGFPECVDSLLAYCDHPDERVRRVAIEHLPCLNDERVGPRLKDALAADNSGLRVAAAAALGEVDESLSIPLLGAALDDHDAWVRYFAVRSLARMDLPADIQEKVVGLAANDSAMQVRIAAVEALKPQAIPMLIELTGSDEDDLAVAALKALGATGSADALPTLKKAATTFHARRQVEAIRALGTMSSKDAVELLRKIALGRDKLLADEATSALGRIATEESVDAILEIMKVPAQRAAAFLALRTLDELAVPVLARRLHSLPLDVRRAVVEVLIAIKTPAAIEILETALADTEPAVRYGALSALTHVRSINRHSGEVIGKEGIA
jgi:HEAT repeat protein